MESGFIWAFKLISSFSAASLLTYSLKLLWSYYGVLQYHCVFHIFFLLMQGSGWKVVQSFEGNFPNRIKQLPLDRHFDISNVKRVGIQFWTSFFNVSAFLRVVSLLTMLLYQVVLEADGYQPYLISPEKGLRSLIKGVLELAKEPSRLCVDEVPPVAVSFHVIVTCHLCATSKLLGHPDVLCPKIFVTIAYIKFSLCLPRMLPDWKKLSWCWMSVK